MFPSWQLILARQTAEHERGRANGFVGAGQGVGPMLGTSFGGLAMARFGWRAMFIGLGIITILWLLPWFLVTRGHSFDAPADRQHQSVSYSAILRQREFWGTALGHFCINYAFYFVMTWLPTFLVKAGGFTVVADGVDWSRDLRHLRRHDGRSPAPLSDRWIRPGDRDARPQDLRC